jgi:hypothetical protein
MGTPTTLLVSERGFIFWTFPMVVGAILGKETAGIATAKAEPVDKINENKQTMNIFFISHSNTKIPF